MYSMAEPTGWPSSSRFRTFSNNRTWPAFDQLNAASHGQRRSENADRDRTLSKRTQRLFAFSFGVVFLVVLIVLAIFFPNLTQFQYTVFRVVLALASAGAAAMFPGFIQVKVPGWLRAGGALAAFAMVFFYNLASLVAPISAELTEPFEQSRARSLLIGYDGAFALARALMGEDIMQDRSRIDEYLRLPGVDVAAFPTDPAGPNGTAEAAAAFARSLAGVLEARDSRLKAAFVLGWFGVISTNTPSISLSGFSVQSAAREAGFPTEDDVGDEEYLEELVRNARLGMGSGQ